jgi:predicted TIM-barrel fold metal-dependent hydrolase
MAKNGFKWIDSDMHLAEPGDFWADYIDPKFRDTYRQWTRSTPDFNSLLRSPGQQLGTSAAPRAASRTATLDASSRIKESHYEDFLPYVAEDGATIKPDGQLRAMDVEGIDAAVLFPTVGGRGWREAPPDAAMAICKAYNDWLRDFCSYEPRRLKLNALVPIGDVDAAVTEMRRVVTQLGAVSISPGSSRVDVRLDDPQYEPLWRAAEELNVPMTFHGSAQLHLQERYRNDPIFSHATGRGIEHPIAFMELLFGGVFERHSNLRFVFLEAGCTWVLYWLFRLEEEWERFRDTVPSAAENVRMAPIDYWRRQCWSGVEVDEWPLKAVIDLVGDDNLVVSSDFPHFDSAFPEASQRFLALPSVGEASKRKIMWDNCARLYNIAE